MEIVKRTTIETLAASLVPTTPSPAARNSSSYSHSPEATAEEVVDALDYVPAAEYEEWLQVGMILHHFYNGSPEGLVQFDKWSRTCPEKYDERAPGKKWDSFGRSAKEPVKVGTLFRLARQGGWPGLYRKRARSVSTDTFASDGPIDTVPSETNIELQTKTIDQLIETSEEVEFQVEGILPAGGAGVLVAEGGTGKTWLALLLGLCVASGRDFLGQFPTKQGRVLVIDEESRDPLLKKRLQKLLRGLGLPAEGKDIPIEFMTGQGLNLSDPAYVIALDRLLKETRPDLVLVDALVRVHTENENDAGAMAKIFAVVKRWINAYGCSFVFCHHRRKPGMMPTDAGNMFRGSSEIRAFMDTQLDLKKATGSDGMITVEHAKSRYAEPVESFNIEIVDTAPDTTIVRYAGTPKTISQERLEQAESFIRSVVADGKWHSRQDLLALGKEADHRRDTLDTARKLMVEAEEVVEERQGKKTGIRKPDSVSDDPVHYKDRRKQNDLFSANGQVSTFTPEVEEFVL